jgi:hypothetical protein
MHVVSEPYLTIREAFQNTVVAQLELCNARQELVCQAWKPFYDGQRPFVSFASPHIKSMSSLLVEIDVTFSLHWYPPKLSGFLLCHFH